MESFSTLNGIKVVIHPKNGLSAASKFCVMHQLFWRSIQIYPNTARTARAIVVGKTMPGPKVKINFYRKLVKKIKIKLK